MTLQLILAGFNGSVDLDSQHPKAPAGCNQQGLSETTDAVARNQSGQLLLWAAAEEKARCAMEARAVRGLEIISQAEIIREGNVWIVPSQTTPMKRYTVNLFIPTCTCPDFEENRGKCKHIYAVEYALQRESGMQLPALPRDDKPKYRQEWHAYNAAQVNEKAKFQLLLHELCRGIEEPIQGMGRRRLPLADVIFASAFKVYSTISGRRFNSDLRDANEKGYLTKMPSYNSMFDYFGYLMLTPYLQQLVIESSLALKEVDWDLAADSSGFSTGVYQRWGDAKWGKARTEYGDKLPDSVNRKDWVKVHLMCGVKTNIVTAAEVSHAHAGDSPFFKSLLETTSRNFPIQSVAADKAYSSNKNLSLVLMKGGMPYIDFRSNATATDRRSPSVWKRMLHFYLYNQEEFKRHYHKRSNVETTFSMIKAKFGERVRSKTWQAQVNEALCKVLCHNICVVIQSIYELGIEPNFWQDSDL